jgi:hypothetical protein
MGRERGALAFVLTEFLHFGILLVIYRRFGAILRAQRAARQLAAAALTGVSPITVLAVGRAARMGPYLSGRYAFSAMPPVMHDNLAKRLWRKLASRKVQASQ